MVEIAAVGRASYSAALEPQQADTSSKLFRGGIGVSHRQMRQARKAVWMGGNKSGEGIIRLARPGRTFPRW